MPEIDGLSSSGCAVVEKRPHADLDETTVDELAGKRINLDNPVSQQPEQLCDKRVLVPLDCNWDDAAVTAVRAAEEATHEEETQLMAESRVWQGQRDGARFLARYFRVLFDPERFVCCLAHSNRVCTLTLHKGHSALQTDSAITLVDFNVSKGCNRLLNSVSGKRKHGGQFLQQGEPLCIIRCADGSAHPVHCCIRGKLIEINQRLVQEPDLLRTHHLTEGWIAILMPKITEYATLLEHLQPLDNAGDVPTVPNLPLLPHSSATD